MKIGGRLVKLEFFPSTVKTFRIKVEVYKYYKTFFKFDLTD